MQAFRRPLEAGPVSGPEHVIKVTHGALAGFPGNLRSAAGDLLQLIGLSEGFWPDMGGCG